MSEVCAVTGASVIVFWANLTSLCERKNAKLHCKRKRTTSLLRSKNFTDFIKEDIIKDSELRTRAKNFALRVITVCDEIDARKGRSVIINQIIRSSMSIGANIHEANYASSRSDFINKFHIAAKECAETEYWIEMLAGCNAISENLSRELLQECGIIHRMLSKSLSILKANADLTK